MVSKQLENILQKDMSRKEFLATLGFGVASILGFSSIIKMLTGKSASHHMKMGMGYGSSAYGGLDKK